MKMITRMVVAFKANMLTACILLVEHTDILETTSKAREQQESKTSDHALPRSFLMHSVTRAAESTALVGRCFDQLNGEFE